MRKGMSSRFAALVLSLAGAMGMVSPAVAQSGKAPITLEFWYALSGHLGEGITKLVDQYNASQSKVVVKATFQGDYYAHATKLQAALVAGNQPDIAQLEISQVGQFGYSGVLADLGPYFSKSDIDRYQGGLMKNSYVNGKFVAVPFNRSTPILYVNRTMLKAAGLDPNGPKNWDELRAFAKKITNKEAGVYGYECPIDIWYFEAGLFQQGGHVLSDDNKNFVFANDQGVAIVRLWQTMIEEGGMKVPPGQDYNAWDVARSDFANQKVAMIVSSTGDLSGLLDQAKGKFDLGTAFLPAGKQYGTPTGGANLVILAKTSDEKKKAAADFLKWLAQKDQASFYSVWSGYLPATNEAVRSDAIQEQYKKFPQYRTALNQLQYAQVTPMIKGWREMTVAIQEELKKAMFDFSITPEAATKSAQDKAQALLNDSQN